MNVTKVRQQQGWHMDKILSAAIMGVWARNPEEGYVKRLFHGVKHNRSRAQIIGVGEIPLNRKGLLSARSGGDEEIV